MSSAWATQLQSVSRYDKDWIANRLQTHVQKLESELQNDVWRASWSGKEIIAELSGQIAPGKPKPMPDIVKVLVKWQRDNDVLPNAIVDLRKTLRQRVLGLV